MSGSEEPRRGGKSRMTMRVYTATRDGIVTEERAEVRVIVGEKTDVYGLAHPWPPCACPHHRHG